MTGSSSPPVHRPKTMMNCSSSPTKSIALTSSKRSSIISLLGVLIAFSLISNTFFWRGTIRGSGGVDDNIGRIDAAWDPVVQDSPKRLFRDGKKVDKRSNGRRVDDIPAIQEFESAKHNRRVDKHQQSINATTPDKMMHGDKSRTKGRPKFAQDGATVKRGRENYNTHRPRLRIFIPHPIRQRNKSSPWKMSLPTSKKSIKHNQLVLLDGNNDTSEIKNNDNLGEWLKQNRNADEDASEDEFVRSQTAVWENDDECVPMSDWQSAIHPTCNSMHEMDISQLLHDMAFSLVSSKGHWRSAWKVDVKIAKANGSLSHNASRSSDANLSKKGHSGTAMMNDYVVIKSLKYIHEPNAEVFELSRVDAISLDVLTPSQFTINIYGFCGSSSVQEFAGGDLKNLLPSLDSIDKLRMATWITNGLADIHAPELLDSSGKSVSTGQNETNVTASLIHNDINMDNVLLGYRNGAELPIFNDFNIAVFRKKNATSGNPCRFRGRFANPQWMSPEQQTEPDSDLSSGYLDEKIDIYALGNILYKIAVGNSPWKYDYLNTKYDKITTDIKGKIQRAKLRGAKPKIPLEIRNTTDPSMKAILTAMNKCYRNDATLRPSAREVAGYLQSELDGVELPLKVMDRFELGR